MKIFLKIKKAVKKIPPGKVTTYGEIARFLKINNPKIVGWALHQNNDPAVPCHRVVNRFGKLAKNYAFGGIQKQKEKLKKEGVKFKDENTVDLKASFWSFF
ncbi:MAG: MGMT family protein [Microgenomates group bacterium]